ncbi:MAG: pyruvate formate lyase family protein [Syntrophales bacterium]
MARLSYVKAEGVEKTARVERLKEAIRSQPLQGDWERDHIYTEYWRHSEGEPILIRRAKAYDKVQTGRTIRIFDDELIVGGISQYLVGAGFYPERAQKWIGEEWDAVQKRDADKFIPAGEKEQVYNDLDFWKDKALDRTVKEAWQSMGLDIVNDMIEEKLTYDLLVINPAGRQIVDFPKVLKKGIKGIIEEIKEIKEKTVVVTADDFRKHNFWNGCVLACNAVITSAKRYAQLAKEMSEKETDQRRKRELEKIAEVCEWVPENPARSFYEALQSVYFTHISVEVENNSYGYSLGRLDQYLYPFYKKDIEEGVISREEASELLSCFWLKLSTIYWLTGASVVQFSQSTNYQNVTIGGRDKNGRDAANELSHLIVEVDTVLKLRQPTLSLRYHDSADEEFLFKVGEDIASGGGKPAIFCDGYAYSVLPLYGVPLDDVIEWAPVGCVEMGIPGKGTHFAGYFVSLPHCLEMVFTNGIHQRSGKKLGVDTGNVENFTNFDQFMDAVFQQQFEYVVEKLSLALRTSEIFVAQDQAPLLFNSALISDCIAEGKDIHRGGAKYTNTILCNPVGLVTTANSLYAIKKLVYDDKVITIKELKEALAANFQGDRYERIRKLCLDVAKYGNDIDEVDDIHRELFRRCNEVIGKNKNGFGEPMAPGYLGILAHHMHGSGCSATPDGRLAFTPFADGSLSPYPGTDTHGPAAVIKSAAKANPSPALSTLFNMKFHPSVFEKPEGMRAFWALIKTYSDLGGYHIQFNVVDRQALLDAKAHPEKYRDLLVRVAGFSAYFVELSPAVQDELISRTEHAF